MNGRNSDLISRGASRGLCRLRPYRSRPGGHHLLGAEFHTAIEDHLPSTAREPVEEVQEWSYLFILRIHLSAGAVRRSSSNQFTTACNLRPVTGPSGALITRKRLPSGETSQPLDNPELPAIVECKVNNGRG